NDHSGCISQRAARQLALGATRMFGCAATRRLRRLPPRREGCASPIQSAMPRPGLSPSELAEDLVARIEQGNTYARSRKNRFRSSSSVVKMVSLALTVASTIILGLQELNIWTGIAFSLVAIVTAVVLMPEPAVAHGSGHLSRAPLRASI